MEALNKVFETILNVFNMIKEFFENLFGMLTPEEETTVAAE